MTNARQPIAGCSSLCRLLSGRMHCSPPRAELRGQCQHKRVATARTASLPLEAHRPSTFPQHGARRHSGCNELALSLKPRAALSTSLPPLPRAAQPPSRGGQPQPAQLRACVASPGAHRLGAGRSPGPRLARLAAVVRAHGLTGGGAAHGGRPPGRPRGSPRTPALPLRRRGRHGGLCVGARAAGAPWRAVCACVVLVFWGAPRCASVLRWGRNPGRGGGGAG